MSVKHVDRGKMVCGEFTQAAADGVSLNGWAITLVRTGAPHRSALFVVFCLAMPCTPRHMFSLKILYAAGRANI